MQVVRFAAVRFLSDGGNAFALSKEVVDFLTADLAAFLLRFALCIEVYWLSHCNLSGRRIANSPAENVTSISTVSGG